MTPNYREIADAEHPDHLAAISAMRAERKRTEYERVQAFLLALLLVAFMVTLGWLAVEMMGQHAEYEINEKQEHFAKW